MQVDIIIARVVLQLTLLVYLFYTICSYMYDYSYKINLIFTSQKRKRFNPLDYLCAYLYR